MTSAPELTVVAPMSLQSWYHMFCGVSTDALFVGEGADRPELLAEQILRASDGRPIRILSGHDSLRRDELVALALREQGARVTSQSTAAVRAGMDKVVQKRALEEEGIPTPLWGEGGTTPAEPRRTLVKMRSSTQSRGLRWWTEEDRGNEADEVVEAYWEEYVDGMEYSVVVHRSPAGSLCFPAVWKGATSSELVPPWRRLRVVPGPSPDVRSHLDSTAIRVAELFDIHGLSEVEFIVTESGTAYVTDVNPRVSGTARLVAMATGLPIFDSALPDLVDADRLDASLCAAEVPYEGTPFVSGSAVATSRITCAGPTWQGVRHEFARHHVVVPATAWPAGFA